MCSRNLARAAAALLWALHATSFAQVVETPPAGVLPAAEAKTQKWEFGVSILAVGGPCAGLYGSFPVPADWPEQQVKVIHEEITPNIPRHAYRELEGLKQMTFQIPQLPAGSAATCFVTVEVIKHPQQPPADTESLMIPQGTALASALRKYLAPSPLIESTNARIRNLAKELTENKETAWEQVRALQLGVRERVTYEPQGNEIFKGAADALRDGKADKEDMTALFVALCRAAKIPARMVWPLDYCYAEFYLENAEKKGAWYPCVVHEEAELGLMKDTRPILEKGDNFKVPEEKAAQRFVREFLRGKGGGGRPSVEFRRRLVN